MSECICIPPVRPAAQHATEIMQTGAIFHWDHAMHLSLFGTIVARTIAERKHYEGFLSHTHRQCPDHPVVFWPRVCEEAPPATSPPDTIVKNG